MIERKETKKEEEGSKELKVEHIPSQLQLEDALTKALPKDRFAEITSKSYFL